MTTAPLDGLAWLTASTDQLAWLVIGLFTAAVALDWYEDGQGRGRARILGAAAWGLFAVFWLALFPVFAFEMQSPIEGPLSLVAAPASLYVGYLLLQGRESLFLLTRAVAFMGLIYMPFTMVPPAATWLIETVARQGEFVMHALGYEFRVARISEHYPESFGTVRGYYDFPGDMPGTYVELACTGLGSMAIFGGLIAAVRAPLRRKLRALAIAIPVIWALNLVRIVFITVVHSHQWLQIFVDPTVAIVGLETPKLVSYFYADRVIAQSLSVVALVGIAWAVAREVPELLTVGEDLLYVVTGDEYDLHEAVGVERTVATDGKGE